MTWVVENPTPDLRQAHTCGGVKPINGIRTRLLIIRISGMVEYVNCTVEVCLNFCFYFILKNIVHMEGIIKILKIRAVFTKYTVYYLTLLLRKETSY